KENWQEMFEAETEIQVIPVERIEEVIQLAIGKHEEVLVAAPVEEKKESQTQIEIQVPDVVPDVIPQPVLVCNGGEGISA
ncbi:MAG TPA: hypothetical protein VHY08_08580, partial [Bacillota bacterium]|nr:hypothetical protein [Bacillota bacterium]